MRLLRSWSLLLVLVPSGLVAQEYKVEAIKQGPPSSISPEITAVLNAQGFRIVDGQGKPFVEIWVRKAVPASARPAGASGVIQFPFLQEGELLGVIQLENEAHDYRDQTIPKGTYTVRYGLQPVNGDHLGVSPFRDYLLLLPGSKDKALAVLPRKQAETQMPNPPGQAIPRSFSCVRFPPPAACRLRR